VEVFLKIGEIASGTDGDIVKTVLGSCIGLCLFDEERKAGGMVHIMLPDGSEDERGRQPGKFAVSAVDALVASVLGKGCRKDRLKAKITGGASMFFKEGHVASNMMVGLRNHEIVVKRLANLEIPTVFEDIGGTTGRNVTFACGTGELTVRNQAGGIRKG